jgi:hypothetical protein
MAFTGLPAANFMLGQERDRLILRLNTSDTNGPGQAIPLCILTAGMPQHVAINYMPGRLTCFVNGNPTLLTNGPLGNLAGWMPGELMFGGRKGFWPGFLDHIAIYNRERTETDARQSYASIAAAMQSRAPVSRLTVEARLVESTAIPEPAAIAPYRRALVVDQYDNVKAIQGRQPGDHLLAARWVILDGQALAAVQREKEKGYRLILESFADHPELEGERLIMDSEELQLPLYYEIE